MDLKGPGLSSKQEPKALEEQALEEQALVKEALEEQPLQDLPHLLLEILLPMPSLYQDLPHLEFLQTHMPGCSAKDLLGQLLPLHQVLLLLMQALPMWPRRKSSRPWAG